MKKISSVINQEKPTDWADSSRTFVMHLVLFEFMSRLWHWIHDLRGLSLTPHSDGVPFAGDSLERSYLFYDRPSRLSSNAPACRGQSRLSGFCCAHRLCVRSPCQHISRMRTFDNNSCAISITSPRSLFRPRTQHGRWGHREKSRRASTRWDCRGKSCLAGLSPLSGTPSERREQSVNTLHPLPHFAPSQK